MVIMGRNTEKERHLHLAHVQVRKRKEGMEGVTLSLKPKYSTRAICATWAACAGPCR
jgi:hypothetical protein